jgi:hypothetical protein
MVRFGLLIRSHPDLSRMVRDDEEGEVLEEEEGDMMMKGEQEEQEEDEETPSLLHTRGKSGLISVWENRIQSEKLA